MMLVMRPVMLIIIIIIITPGTGGFEFSITKLAHSMKRDGEHEHFILTMVVPESEQS